jgi:hypothetical protein
MLRPSASGVLRLIRLLDRKVSGFFALEDSRCVTSSFPLGLGDDHSVADTGGGELVRKKDRRR